MNKKQYKNFVLSCIKSFKMHNHDDFLTMIPVYNHRQQIIVFLRPITYNFVQTLPNICDVITQWKIQNPSISFSLFKTITSEMTKEWIVKHVLGRNDRLLFVIVGIDGRYLGYIGVSEFDFSERTMQIDAVLRGVKNSPLGMITFASKQIILFGYNTLKVKDIYGTSMKSNSLVEDYHKRIGQNYIGQYPIKLIKINQNESRWVKCQQSQAQDFCLKGKIDKSLYQEFIK